MMASEGPLQPVHMLSRVLFLTGLQPTVNPQEVHEAFNKIGCPLYDILLAKSRHTRSCLGFGFVLAQDHYSARRAASHINMISRNFVSALVIESPHQPPDAAPPAPMLFADEAASLARIALEQAFNQHDRGFLQVLHNLAGGTSARSGAPPVEDVPDGPQCPESSFSRLVPAAAWKTYPHAKALFDKVTAIPLVAGKSPLLVLNEYLNVRGLKMEVSGEASETQGTSTCFSCDASIIVEREVGDKAQGPGVGLTTHVQAPSKKAMKQLAALSFIDMLIEKGVTEADFGVDAALAKSGRCTLGKEAVQPIMSLLTPYPRCKELLQNFHRLPANGAKTPVMLLNEYASRRDATTKFAEQNASAANMFRSQIQLVSKSTEEVLYTGEGEAGSKQDSRHVAAAAVIELILSKDVDWTAFGLKQLGSAAAQRLKRPAEMDPAGLEMPNGNNSGSQEIGSMQWQPLFQGYQGYGNSCYNVHGHMPGASLPSTLIPGLYDAVHGGA